VRTYEGDMFADFINPDALCITTNGDTNTMGSLIMGAGNAKEARSRFPGLDVQFGKLVRDSGNRVHVVSIADLGGTKRTVVSLPTKHSYKDATSDLMLITTSLIQLLELANKNKWQEIILPQPGTSNGKLNWETQVRPICESFLDDRFIVVSRDDSTDKR